MAWEAAGLTRVTFHEARHASASLWLAAGVDLVEVSRILGHASLSITADVYGHRVPGAEARAARTLDRYLGRGVAG
jgi:integrase